MKRPGLCLALFVAALPGGSGHGAGLGTIEVAQLQHDVIELAAAPLEGRDSPSVGLERAARHIEDRLRDAGFAPAPGDDDYRSPFRATVQIPVPDATSLTLEVADDRRVFVYGDDFVPVAGATGKARGELVFVGYGIDSSKEGYNDLRGPLAGKVALVLEGEPRHRRKFDGLEVTAAASLYTKLRELERKDVAGVIVVRRTPIETGLGKLSRALSGELELPEPAQLGFRHTWARWAAENPGDVMIRDLPALEVTAAVGSALLGTDVEELARKIDRRAKPVRFEVEGRVVAMTAASTRTEAAIDNVVGLLAGSDPQLAGEYLVLGAHYDHVGVDVRGRIGYGADDNASGTAVMLEVAEALAAAEPRRSILVCAFAAEEDGLLGSRAWIEKPPVPRQRIVAMINLDMVGRGEEDEVAVIGTAVNPDLAQLVKRANSLSRTRIKKLVLGKGRELFERSDHYPFHQAGIPAIFFFEGLPISRNKDYHTWRDTADKLDFEKMKRTAHLVYNTAWLLANDDERPGPPR